MSYLAIGAVTKAIAELLAKKLNKPPLLGTTVAKVTTLPPDDERVSDSDGVNLFLYRVAESPFIKNSDWRGDKVNPSGSKRPPLALTLHYLLTAYAMKGDSTAQDDITAHHLLGNAMAVLHEHPVLNDVHDSDFDASLDAQLAAELRNSFEKIRISLMPASMEEASKIWTGFSKPYRLSVFYDVSLVEIAPVAPAPMPGPPVEHTNLRVSTIDLPVITSITPAGGPAGGQVSLTGAGFKSPGIPTVVTINDITLAETELAKLTAAEILLTIPEAPRGGPKLRLRVSVGGRESAPEFYLVEPWISSITPLRGITGIPLSIPFDAPPGVTLGVEFDGKTVASTYGAESKTVSVKVPTSITTNGPKTVVLLLGSNPPQRSNALFFEVLPIIKSVTVTSQSSPAQTNIAVTGQRLNGKDVYVKYGGLLIRKGENTDPNQLNVDVLRVLAAGQPASVVVDGRESNVVPPQLESIEPPEAYRGAAVTLKGKSLSGKSVVVKFGAARVTVGPQAYASQLTVPLPVQLTPGTVQVKVTVNGKDTNKLPFKVLA